MLNSSGRMALNGGISGLEANPMGRYLWAFWQREGRDECWERVFHRVVDGYGFLRPSSFLCRVVLEGREAIMYPRHLVR